MKKIFAIAMVATMVLAFGMADAITYRGNARVGSSYRYAGYTPQVITIKTGNSWWKSPWGKGQLFGGKIDYIKIKVAPYRWKWYYGASWKQHTFTYNEIRSMGIKCYPSSYYKHWYDRFTQHSYLMFTIKLPKTKKIIFPKSGYNVINAEVKFTGAYYKNGFHKFTIKIYGNGKVYVRKPSWRSYKHYWGISSISAQSLEQSGIHISGYYGNMPSDNLYVSSVNETNGQTNVELSTVGDTGMQIPTTVDYSYIALAVATIAIISAMVFIVKKKK